MLFIGIEDDGSCAKPDIDDELLSNLAQMRDGTIQPIPTIKVEKEDARWL